MASRLHESAEPRLDEQFTPPSSLITKRSLVRLLPFIGLAAYALIKCAQIAWATIRTPYVFDSSIYLYLGKMMWRHQWVPFREFIEENQPLTFYIFRLLAMLEAIDPAVLRTAELLLVVGLLWLGARSLTPARRPLHAYFFFPMFLLLYMSAWPLMGLQRDLLVLILVAMARWLSGEAGRRIRSTPILVGLCCGAAIAIKPQAVIFLPLLVAETRRRAALLLSCTIAVLFPITILWLQGGLPGFQHMVKVYWPLYNSLSASIIFEPSAAQRLLEFIATLSGRRPAGMIAIILTVMNVLTTPWRRLERTIWTAWAWWAASFLYAVLGGKGFLYHYFPFFFWGVVLLGYNVVAHQNLSRLRTWLAASLTILASLVWIRECERIYAVYAHELARTTSEADRVRALLAREQQDSTETVIVDGWIRGPTFLILRQLDWPISTSSVYTFRLYVPAEYPPAAELRSDFLREARAVRPQWILSGPRSIWPATRDSVGNRIVHPFIEYESWVYHEYELIYDSDGRPSGLGDTDMIQLWRRKATAVEPATRIG